MAKGTRICKICGKEYPYCSTITQFDGNRWQDVACCIEHATQYFKAVAIARGELKEEAPKTEAPKKEAPVKVKPVKVQENKEDKKSEVSKDAEQSK